MTWNRVRHRIAVREARKVKVLKTCRGFQKFKADSCHPVNVIKCNQNLFIYA